MEFGLHRCRWHFHIFPRLYVGSYDFNRGRGVLIDWLGWTLEVNVK